MTEEILAKSLRPQSLSALVGQDALVKALRRQIATRPPRAFLLHGGTGTGKTTTARIIALSFQCTHQTEWGEPCETCRSKSFEIHEVNASEVNGVEEIGKVAEMSQYRPMPPSRRRIIILDEAHMMTNNAQNLLLKHFEETPQHTVWIICTTVPSKILATLRRRCVVYRLKNLSFSDRERLLERAAQHVQLARPLEHLIEAVNRSFISSPALLLMALENYASGMSAADAASAASTDGAGTESLRICKAVTSGDWTALRKLLASTTPEDARWVRASVLGYLRGMLVRESDRKRQSIIAESMLTLTAMAPLEDALLMQWLWASLYKVCRKF